MLVIRLEISNLHLIYLSPKGGVSTQNDNFGSIGSTHFYCPFFLLRNFAIPLLAELESLALR